MLETRALGFAGTTIFLYAGVLVVFVLAKAIGIEGIGWIFPVVLVAALAGSSLLARRSGSSWKEIRTRAGAFLAGVVLSGVAATLFYDVSFDGRWYHQEAIIRLDQGFDPLREELDKDSLPGGLWSIEATGKPITSGPTWINHYPKASEISAATVYAFSGDIEVAKLFNFLLAFGAFALLVGLFQGIWPGRPLLNGALAAALVANPVVISQLWTYYVDGQLYLLMVALGGFLLLHARTAAPGWLVLAGLAVVGLVNTKFTGLVYAVAIVGVHTGLWWWRTGWRRPTWFDGILPLSLVIGSLVVGFNPYVRNIVLHGHPFHPVMGSRTIEIVGDNAAREFAGIGRLDKFLQCTFASTSGTFSMVDGRLPPKIPFTFAPAEFREAAMPDVRVGGFGPFYGGLLLCALVAWCVGLVQRLRGKGADPESRSVAFGIGATLALCLATAFAIPEMWWARYVPQLWAVPFLLWLTVRGSETTESVRRAGLATTCAIALAGSLGILVASVAQNGRWTLIVERDFDRLAGADAPLQVHFGQRTGDRLKYLDRSIAFVPFALPDSMSGPFSDTLFYGGVIRHSDPELARRLDASGGGIHLLRIYLRNRFVEPVLELLQPKVPQ